MVRKEVHKITKFGCETCDLTKSSVLYQIIILTVSKLKNIKLTPSKNHNIWNLFFEIIIINEKENYYKLFC